jgi:hypothetical protein
MKNLPLGTALITSENLERPVLTKIRVRRSKHGGAAVDLIKTRESSGGAPRQRIPMLGTKIDSNSGVVGMLKKRLVGTDTERRQDTAREKVHEIVEQKEQAAEEQKKADEWKENLTPDEIDFLEEHKVPGLGKRIRGKIWNGFKGFFVEDE